MKTEVLLPTIVKVNRGNESKPTSVTITLQSKDSDTKLIVKLESPKVYLEMQIGSEKVAYDYPILSPKCEYFEFEDKMPNAFKQLNKVIEWLNNMAGKFIMLQSWKAYNNYGCKPGSGNIKKFMIRDANEAMTKLLAKCPKIKIYKNL